MAAFAVAEEGVNRHDTVILLARGRGSAPVLFSRPAGKVVSAESYRLMTTAEGAASRGARQYGFGLQIDSIAGRMAISHGGGIHGFITASTWVPSAELSVTVLTNSGSAKSGEP